MFKIVTALALVALSAAAPVPEEGKKATPHHEGFNQDEDILLGMMEDFGEDEEHAAADVKRIEAEHPELAAEWAQEHAKEAANAKKPLTEKEISLVRFETQNMGETEAEAIANLREIEKTHPEVAEGAPLTEIESGLLEFEEQMGETFGEALLNAKAIEDEHPEAFRAEVSTEEPIVN